MKIIFIGLGSLFVLVLVIGFLCLSGGLFYLWPTWTSNQKIEITQEMIGNLKDFRKVDKFIPDEAQHYPGLKNEPKRLLAQSLVDSSLDYLAINLEKHPNKFFVMGVIKTMLFKFGRFDSEEQDRVCLYSEKIMDILKIKDSGELINVWRYGFPFGWFEKRS